MGGDAIALAAESPGGRDGEDREQKDGRRGD